MNDTKIKLLCRGSAVAAVLAAAGCANEPTLTERNFGDSVRQMIRAQTYDQSTLETPSEDAVERTDGQMLEGALETYRSDVAAPDSAGGSGDRITIDVGGGGR